MLLQSVTTKALVNGCCARQLDVSAGCSKGPVSALRTNAAHETDACSVLNSRRSLRDMPRSAMGRFEAFIEKFEFRNRNMRIDNGHESEAETLSTPKQRNDRKCPGSPYISTV